MFSKWTSTLMDGFQTTQMTRSTLEHSMAQFLLWEVLTEPFFLKRTYLVKLMTIKIQVKFTRLISTSTFCQVWVTITRFITRLNKRSITIKNSICWTYVLSLNQMKSLGQIRLQSSLTINGIHMLECSRRLVCSSTPSSWFALIFTWTRFTLRPTETTFIRGNWSYSFRWYTHSATTIFKWFTKVHSATSLSSGTTMICYSFTLCSSLCSARDSNFLKSTISHVSYYFAFVHPALLSKHSSSWESSKEFHIW